MMIYSSGAHVAFEVFGEILLMGFVLALGAKIVLIDACSAPGPVIIGCT
jgi:hypothetical protein